MISFAKQVVLGAVALVGFASTASANYVPAVWTDTIGGSHYVSPLQPHTYSHDITDFGSGGFQPLEDWVTDFDLTIDIWDDQRFDLLEVARVRITGIQHGTIYDFGAGAFQHGLTVLGLIELNAFGTLTVTVQSVCSLVACGDFNVGASTLVATGYQKVPEPTTIALLGVGLLGLGLGRRKARK